MSSPSTLPLSIYKLDEDKAPESFSGGIGNFELHVDVVKNISTDDIIKLQINVSGTGDIKRFLAPKLTALSDEFELYPAKVVQEEQFFMNNKLAGRKVFEYALQAKHTGKINLNPILSFYNSETHQFIQIDTIAIPLEVQQGNHQLSEAAKRA